MPLLSENQFEKELKPGWERGFLLLTGPEFFKVDRFRRTLQAQAEKRSWAIERMSSEDWDGERYLETLRSLSLFQAGTFLWVSEAEKLNAKAWDLILANLDGIPEGVQILVTLDAADGRRSYSTKLQKHASAAIVKFDWVEQSEFMEWARSLCRERKRKIDQEACLDLWERVGPSLFELDQAVEKVTLFDPSNQAIGQDSVAAVVAQTRPELVFGFTDALAANDIRGSHAALATLLAQGEEPIALVALIGRQYRWLYEIDARTRAGESTDAVLRSLGIYPRVAKALLSTLKRQKSRGIARGLQAVRDADLALKSSGQPPRLVLDRLTFQLLGVTLS